MAHSRGSQRLEIVGTIHVDRTSIQRVRDKIDRAHPSVVAVELCEERLSALEDLDRGRLSSPIGIGFLPWLLVLLERAVGALTDVFPGTEMLEAVEEARKVGAQVVLIDKPIGQILENVRRVPFFERLRIGADAVLAMFAVRISRKQNGSRIGNANLEQLMAEFGKKYPTLWRILVEDRDRYMADRLREILSSTTGRVVAVVGFGHLSGISQNLASTERGLPAEGTGLRYEWTIEGSSP